MTFYQMSPVFAHYIQVALHHNVLMPVTDNVHILENYKFKEA